MRVLYFYRDDTIHDRRFLDALSIQPVDIIALRLESRIKRIDAWNPPGNVRFIQWTRSDEPFQWIHKPLLIKDLRRIIREINADVVHAGPIDLCGYLAARSGFKPLVAMSWGYDLLYNADQRLISRSRIRYTLEHAAVMLADCEAVRDKAGRFGFSSERIVTFPWGVDVNLFHPGSGKSIRERLGWNDQIILLSTRSMEKLYGCDVLVDAFIKASCEDESLCLLMLGTGSQMNRLKQMVSSAGLNHRIVFMGSVPESEIVQYFLASDIYISASHSDGSSVSLLQAMACGIAPLVSDIPGNREWVIPHQNGWLFEDGNSTALAAMIIQASRSPQLRSKFGIASRRIAQERADWKINSRKLIDAYQLAINYQPGGVMGS